MIRSEHRRAIPLPGLGGPPVRQLDRRLVTHLPALTLDPVGHDLGRPAELRRLAVQMDDEDVLEDRQILLGHELAEAREVLDRLPLRILAASAERPLGQIA